MNSGLYVRPGCSPTARAAATARRFAEPVTKFSKRCRASTCMRARGSPAAGAQPAQHELGDAAQRFEHARAVQRVGGEIRHAAKVDRVGQFLGRENEVAWQILLVVLNDEGNGSRIRALLRQVLV